MSGTNICYLAYPFEYEATLCNFYFYLSRILTTDRNEEAAKEAANLVLNVQKKCKEGKIIECQLGHLSQLTIIGYSLGVHIAASLCRHLYEKSGQKVGKLIG